MEDPDPMTSIENRPPTALKTGDVVDVGNRKEANRQVRGIFIGLILAALVWSISPEGAVDSVNATYGGEDTNYTHASMRLTAAVAVLMAAWWVTEAVPLAITALLPLIIFPIAQIIPFDEIASPFASPTIFLFMGGFILALGLQRWNLHRRLALHVILLVGTKPKQMIAGFMLATALLSMWVSNTATAVVMLPIGTSVLALTAEVVGGHKNQKKFASGLMLATAYSASIASVSTIISTPPNAMLAAYMASAHGIEIGFAQWMMVGLPLAMAFLVLAWLVLTTVFKPEMKEIPGGKEMIRAELAKMGPMPLGEKLTGVVFLGAALSWVFLPFIFDWIGSNVQIADAAIGLTASLLLFLIPVNRGGTRLLDWKSANKLPWDVLLLFGGGLALSKMFTTSGLSLWIGELASGYVRIGDMLKGGFWLNVIALFLVTLTTYFIAVPVFGLVLP